MDFVSLVVVAVAVTAAAVDLRSGRIPNVLTFGSSVAALAYHIWTTGFTGAGYAFAGWGVGVALFLPMFLLGGMGAGDVKLLGAVGAWLGPMGAIHSGVASVLVGGVLGLLIAARHRYLGSAFRNLWGVFAFWRAAGVQPVPGVTLSDSPGPKLAYGVAIAVGTLTTVLFR